MVVAGLMLSGWLEAALAAGESFEAFEMRVKATADVASHRQ
jgi:hypothetical protein